MEVFFFIKTQKITKISGKAIQQSATVTQRECNTLENSKNAKKRPKSCIFYQYVV